jgi:hypothetical protein
LLTFKSGHASSSSLLPPRIRVRSHPFIPDHRGLAGTHERRTPPCQVLITSIRRGRCKRVLTIVDCLLLYTVSMGAMLPSGCRQQRWLLWSPHGSFIGDDNVVGVLQWTVGGATSSYLFSSTILSTTSLPFHDPASLDKSSNHHSQHPHQHGRPSGYNSRNGVE